MQINVKPETTTTAINCDWKRMRYPGLDAEVAAALSAFVYTVTRKNKNRISSSNAKFDNLKEPRNEGERERN